MEVSLEAVLEERERRAFRRSALSSEYGRTIVQLTIATPGRRKDGDDIRKAFRYGTVFLERALAGNGLRTLHGETRDGDAGPSGTWVVEADAALVKRVATDLEDGYSLGRLWDIDVYGPEGFKLDREAGGSAARRCFVCGSTAAVCAGRRLHEIADVERRFGEMLARGIEEMESKGVFV